MIHAHTSDDDDLAPAYAGRLNQAPIPRHELPDGENSPTAVYRLIHDELLLDGSSRLNMATFVTTWMEPEADRLMAETFDKNMIDKDEYPQTAEIERRCVNIVANLFHAPADGDAIGVSTIGSSEAVMLAGLAMKWRWRKAREAAGAPTDRPNMVMGSNVQVVWEKFCRYWDVEPRYVPVTTDRFVVDPDEVMARVDADTIGVIPILGTTFTGEFEPIEEIHDRVVAFNDEHDLDVPIHVDAASGGFVAPFIHPDLAWDFRLPQVKSINVSGHKYGLTYPGIGFAIWRSADDLPEDLVFHVNYLGGDMPTFTLNFSRPGNQVVGQYYNFVRLGREGYTRIMEALRDVAMHLSSHIAAMPAFEVISDGSAIPVLSFRMADDQPFTVFHVSERLRAGGWQVPAYTMPPDAEEVAVLRIVVREGLSMDLANGLLEDLDDAVAHLQADPPSHPPEPAPFSHT
ncbi:glutamate decarboxylase [Salsipaludibacter albus]|uniref:glutamate decarboxylase n=1 Tax=Salsipaludibacter albus TaxID=2849650 RepID=UPI001EE3CDB7|nr:glutamate decarboxylase [Salsipaludibacter albus]MBY5161327.1 glutamate decarboxylase [Salsipaludibacter albus]